MPRETPVQLSLAELFARYLDRQAAAHAGGFAFEPKDVTPYEAGPAQPIDPQLAWHEALTPLTAYDAAVKVDDMGALPHWAALVAGREPMLAVAFAAGNFPQLVRDFRSLLGAAEMPEPGPAVHVPELEAWAEDAAAKRTLPHMLVAVGGLRLAQQHDSASAYLDRHDGLIPAAWRAGWENERAALLWHAGARQRARALWQAQPPNTAVLFNRGLAALFLGEPAAARAPLQAAIGQLAGGGGWQHLAQLYLTLAELRG